MLVVSKEDNRQRTTMPMILEVSVLYRPKTSEAHIWLRQNLIPILDSETLIAIAAQEAPL